MLFEALGPDRQEPAAAWRGQWSSTRIVGSLVLQHAARPPHTQLKVATRQETHATYNARPGTTHKQCCMNQRRGTHLAPLVVAAVAPLARLAVTSRPPGELVQLRRQGAPIQGGAMEHLRRGQGRHGGAEIVPPVLHTDHPLPSMAVMHNMGSMCGPTSRP